MFKVRQMEVQFRLLEVLHHHLVIIFGYSIVDRQIPIVVFCIQFWPNILNNTRLTFQANNVLDGLALVVLLTSSQEEIVGAGKPVEHLDITFSSTHEEHVFTQVVLHKYSS